MTPAAFQGADGHPLVYPVPLFVRNTFIDCHERPPSLDGFFQERRVSSCPTSLLASPGDKVPGEGDDAAAPDLPQARQPQRSKTVGNVFINRVQRAAAAAEAAEAPQASTEQDNKSDCSTADTADDVTGACARELRGADAAVAQGRNCPPSELGLRASPTPQRALGLAELISPAAGEVSAATPGQLPASAPSAVLASAHREMLAPGAGELLAPRPGELLAPAPGDLPASFCPEQYQQLPLLMPHLRAPHQLLLPPPPLQPPVLLPGLADAQTEIACPSLSPTSASLLVPPELPSIGSVGHQSGQCKPCAFMHSKGCKTGRACQFCHLCEPGEKKRRQKEKRAFFSTMRQLRQFVSGGASPDDE